MEPITGARVELRPVEASDLDMLSAWFGDPAFVKWWGGEPLSRESVAAKYLGHRENVTSLVVTEQGRPVGYAQWSGGDDRQGGIDLILIPEAQGRGLGSDAADALARHLLQTVGWCRVTVDPDSRNTQAVRAWHKAGFRVMSERRTTLIMAREK